MSGHAVMHNYWVSHLSQMLRVVKVMVRRRGRQVFKIHGLFCITFQTHLTEPLPIAHPPSIFLPCSGPLSGFCKVYPARTSSESSRQLGKWHTLLLCTNNCTHKHTHSAVTRQDAVLACRCKCSCRPLSALIFQALQFSSTKAYCLPAATVKKKSRIKNVLKCFLLFYSVCCM